RAGWSWRTIDILSRMWIWQRGMRPSKNTKNPRSVTDFRPPPAPRRDKRSQRPERFTMSFRPPAISRRAWEVFKFRVIAGLIVLAMISLPGLFSFGFFVYIMLMIGPPGTGKTMLSRRLPTILPPLTPSESLETTRIYSALGRLKANEPLLATRPFRDPHH